MKSTSAQPPTKAKRNPRARFAAEGPFKPPRDTIVVGPDGVVRVPVSSSADIREIEVEVIRRVLAASDFLVANSKTPQRSGAEASQREGMVVCPSALAPFDETQAHTQSVSAPVPASLGANQVLIRALVAGGGMERGGQQREFNTDDILPLLRHLIGATDPGRRHAVLDVIEESLAEYRNSFTPQATDTTEVVVQRLRQQSAASRADDVRAGRLIQGKELAERLHLVRQSISAGLKSNRLFAFKLEHGRLYYPAFFADEQYDRSVLEAVSKDLGDLSAGSKWDFFMRARHSLQDKTPLEALKTGQLDAVRRAAQAFAES